MPALLPHDLTGLVLAGGLGQRMGGADKGLQPWRGQPLVQHVMARLAPQVGRCLISANRNLDRYRRLGATVISDSVPDHPGPLAGFLSGLQHCTTPWLLTVPCDSPRLPLDLAERLGLAVQEAGAEIALAATREPTHVQRQPVFSLLTPALAPSLARFMAGGGRSIAQWAATRRCVEVPFDDCAAFANANTLEDLERLQ